MRRDVTIVEGGVCVTDRVLDRSAGSMQVTWLMHPNAIDNYAVSAEGSQRMPVSEDDVTGWYSPTYGLRRKSCAVSIVRRVEDGLSVIDTIICARLRA